MIGMVGDDAAGDLLRRTLSSEGVDVSGVGTAVGTGSGMAVITVDAAGENTIVVDPAANGALTADHVSRFASVLRGAAVTLAQLEVPIDAVAAAARLAGGRFVLNPAPAAAVPVETMARVAVLVPNRTEVARIAGGAPPQTAEEAMAIAATITGPEAIVVTLGSAGAVIVTARTRHHVMAPEVEVVDPTAAGDAFCGGLAGALADGASLGEAVRWAVRCGAVAATRWGAQASLPSRADVAALEGS
jgi:ribokinase